MSSPLVHVAVLDAVSGSRGRLGGPVNVLGFLFVSCSRRVMPVIHIIVVVQWISVRVH